jgi:hypothetical protein
MVIETYLDLLASDRALLVPILGSFAEMPLNVEEKTQVIDVVQVTKAQRHKDRAAFL